MIFAYIEENAYHQIVLKFGTDEQIEKENKRLKANEEHSNKKEKRCFCRLVEELIDKICHKKESDLN